MCRHPETKAEFVFDPSLGTICELTCLVCEKRWYGVDPAINLIQAGWNALNDPLKEITDAGSEG